MLIFRQVVFNSEDKCKESDDNDDDRWKSTKVGNCCVVYCVPQICSNVSGDCVVGGDADGMELVEMINEHYMLFRCVTNM